MTYSRSSYLRMSTTTYNLKNLCRWVRRNYPKIAHLTNEDLAIFPLQEWWERNHKRGQDKAQQPVQPAPEQPVVKRPVTKQPVTKQAVTKQPDIKQPDIKQPVVRQLDDDTAYHMRRIAAFQKRRIIAKNNAHRWPAVDLDNKYTPTTPNYP
jgi:hypothetical protein